MKKYLFYTAVAIVCTGCTAEPIQEDIIVDNNGGVVTLNASIEGFENDTRTTYTDNISLTKALVSWSAGDKISILYKSGGYKKTEFTTANGDGIFTGTPSGTEGGDYAYWAIYPYNICTDLYGSSSSSKESTTITLPAEYTGNGANGIPMSVHTLKANFDGTYRFKHMGSVLRFSITNIPSNARHLVITNDTRELAGRYYTSYDSTNDLLYYTFATADDDATVGAMNSVTYHFTPNADGSYTFFLPYGVYTADGNFTFTFKDSENADICSRTTTLGTLASTTLVRNTMYRIIIDAMTFNNYPGISSLAITPSVMKSDINQSFTVGGINFYAYEAFKENSTNIKINGDTGLSGRIYNTTSLGRIIKVVVEKDACTYSYDGSYYTVYAGTTSNPSSQEITKSSYVYDDYAEYTFTGGSYSFFAIENNKTWNNRVGKITIYYYKPAE